MQVLYVPVRAQHSERSLKEFTGQAAERQVAIRNLALAYDRYLVRRKHFTLAHRFPLYDGSEMRTDLFDRTDNRLFAVAAHSNRAEIRHALAHLGDCGRFLDRPALAVLAPDRPDPDLLALVRHMGAEFIYLNAGGSFIDSGARSLDAVAAAAPGYRGPDRAQLALTCSCLMSGTVPDSRAFTSTLATCQRTSKILTAQEALSAARSAGNRDREARALLDLGLGYASVGLTVEATTSFEEAAELAHELGDSTMLAKALANAGSQLHQSGQNAEALDLSRRAVAEFQVLGDRTAQLRTLANCAVIERSLGQPEPALATVSTALGLAKELDDRALFTGLLGIQGDLLTELGRSAEARAARQQAVQAARRYGDDGSVGFQLERLGELQLLDGLFDDALRSYFEAGELHRKRKDIDGRYRVVLQLGLVYQHRMRWAEAEAALGEALELCRRTGDSERLPYITASLASAKLGLGRFGDAAQLAEQAATGYRALSDEVGAGRALATLGQAHEALGERPKAETAWHEALTLLGGRDEIGAGAVRQLLGV